MTKIAIKNEQKALNAAISGIAAHDSLQLEKIFEKCRTSKKKMTLLVRAVGLTGTTSLSNMS